ncbi:MAG: Gfo/Idh/MocA family oxidoreductase [Pseudomonadota bacterium]
MAERQPTRIACVGAGYFAAFHHAAWAALDGADLVAIADRDIDRARQAAETAGAGQAVGSLAEALALGVDLVDIATPPETHLDLIDEASAAGCAIICQKPLCGGLAGARRAVEIAEARGTTLIVHENFRFQPWWRQMKAELDAGRLGALYGLRFDLRPGDGQGPRAYLDRQPYFQTMPRLLVHETAVHFIDTFRFLMGDPDWVMADLRRLNPAIAGEDAGLIVLGYDDGRRAIFDGNRLAGFVAENRRLTMGEGLAEGELGSLRLSGDGALAFRAHDSNAWQPVPVEIAPNEFGGGCVRTLQAHALDALAAGSLPENHARAYLANLMIVEAVYEANARHTRVALNMSSEARDGA